jgi:hypothetical protein
MNSPLAHTVDEAYVIACCGRTALKEAIRYLAGNWFPAFRTCCRLTISVKGV